MPTTPGRSLTAVPLLSSLLMLCALGPAPAWGQATQAAQAAPGPRIIIDSSPPGATVYIDGKEKGVQGYTSSTFKLRLSRGPHRVLLELEGYKPVEQVINVTQAQKFTFTLERAPARLEVKPPGTNESARGGEVFVDGAPAGTVPVTVEVPSGRHLIEVRKSGYRVFSETVELRAGDTRTLWVSLQSEVKAGSLLIAADAPADVFVDGVPRGQAPILVDNLPEGDHLVEVRRTEPGAPPWRQNVRVTAGQQARVIAQTQAPGSATGSLMVVCAVADAEVVVDGAVRGKVNQEIANLRPGQHVIDVRAKGYGPVNKVVEIEAGRQRVERVELTQPAEARGMGVLRVIMINPVEGAQYYLNGRKVDEGVMLAERGMEVPAGQNIIIVRREGFGQVRKEINVRPGGLETVSIDLRNVGKIFVTSTPRGAEVLLDNLVVGRTPYTAEEVPAGQHVVELRLAEHQPYVQQVTVRGGEQANLNVPLQHTEPKPPPEDPYRKRGQSSFSALSIDPGGFTADVGLGYPYFFNVRLTVGAYRRQNFGIDAGAEFRTMFNQTDVGGTFRVQWWKFGPLALGTSLFLGGGGGPRSRNEVVFETSLPLKLTLLAGNLVRLTVHPYLQVYSDQNCPSLAILNEVRKRQDAPDSALALAIPEHPSDRCTNNYDPRARNMMTDPGSGGMGYDFDRERNAIQDATGVFVDGNNKPQINPGWPRPYNPDYSFDTPEGTKFFPYRDGGSAEGTPVLERFTGVRYFIQAAVEIAITQHLNLWVLMEGAPFQAQRAAYTRAYNRFFPGRDLPLYGRVGLTAKF